MREKKIVSALTMESLTAIPSGTWDLSENNNTSLLVGPAFFDPQINGYAGIDFQNPGLTMEELEYSVLELHKAGCSHFLLTLITADVNELEEKLSKISQYRKKSAVIEKSVLGVHLEGPFISSKKSANGENFYGPHPIKHIRPPDWTLFKKLQKAGNNIIKMVTLAPEYSKSEDFIRKLRVTGVIAALGHTDASLEEIGRAVAAGASVATHFGSGCPGWTKRHDNIIQRLLFHENLLLSIIPDGIHIPGFALSNFVRGFGERIVFTTDCISAAGAAPGKYSFADLDIVVGNDRVVSNPAGPGLAGSALRPIEGFYNAVKLGGMSISQSWRAWTKLRDMYFPEATAPIITIPWRNCKN